MQLESIMSNEKLAFQGLYSEAKNNVQKALTDISSIQLEDERGHQHLQNIKARLQDISKKFGDDIQFLENNSEWDKFTIAFFGETGAGKSTILEALRIVFNEKERQEQIENGKAIAEDLEKSFAENSNHLIKALGESAKKFEHETRDLRGQIQGFTETVNDYNKEKKNFIEAQEICNQTVDKYKKLYFFYIAIAVVSIIFGAILMKFLGN